MTPMLAYAIVSALGVLALASVPVIRRRRLDVEDESDADTE